MYTLIDWVTSLSPQQVRRLSRVRIEPRPGKTTVTGSVALFLSPPPLAVDNAGTVLGPVLRQPVAVTDTAGRMRQSPPVKLGMQERASDITGVINSAALAEQIEALRRSDILGGLNVERRPGGAIVITTHAATQSERDKWLRQIKYPLQ